MYLSLFDFEINHVPAEKHKAPDGLSRRKCSPCDSDEEDVEDYLDKFISGVLAQYEEDSPLLSLSSRLLYSPMMTACSSELLSSLMTTLRTVPQTPYGEYDMPTSMNTICRIQLDKDDDEHDSLVGRIRRYNGFSFDPAFFDPEQKQGSLLDHSLLKSTDSMTYTGHKLEDRKVPYRSWVEVKLGDDVFKTEITSYGYEFMTSL